MAENETNTAPTFKDLALAIDQEILAKNPQILDRVKEIPVAEEFERRIKLANDLRLAYNALSAFASKMRPDIKTRKADGTENEATWSEKAWAEKQKIVQKLEKAQKAWVTLFTETDIGKSKQAYAAVPALINEIKVPTGKGAEPAEVKPEDKAAE